MKLAEILKSIFPSLRIPRDRHLSEEELEFLEDLASDLEENSTILEIGCQNGASTYALAKGARKNMSEVYAIAAMNAPPVLETENTFWKLKFPNVNILPPSYSPAQWNNGFQINLFYVNSPNDISDYVLWERFLAKDAVVAYHDVNWPRDGKQETTEQVNELIKKINGKCIQSVDSITSFALPGYLDDYYASHGMENPFTKKNPADSAAS